jgi:leucyl/phenylalanyl-tRNA--protein transferase
VVLLDVQWLTAHLASLGAVEVPRTQYLNLLTNALTIPIRPFNSEVSP